MRSKFPTESRAEDRRHSRACCASSSCRRPWAVPLLWLSLCAITPLTAAVCNAVAYTDCPTALVAAKAMTNNSIQLPITNAAFSGVCHAAAEGYLLITDMGCHALAPLMPMGALVLSTGDAVKATSLTNTADDTTLTQTGGHAGDDADMQAASNAAGYVQTLFDQAILTFDITPTVSGNLAFQYVFGSEEYPEFVPAANPSVNTNDVFGFFIWSGTNTPVNVAILPNSTAPVSIATANAINNPSYFVENYFGSSAWATEYDGFTTLLKTQDFHVTAGTTYHIKLGIADGGDPGYDSVVWVKAGSVRFNIKDCVGGFVPNGQCSGHCEGGTGILPEVYNITVAAQNGGNPCPIANGTTRSNTTCINNDMCPVNCTASWVAVPGGCDGACGGGTGFTTQEWIISSPAMYGGYCANANGTMRATSTSCTNNNPCAPIDCVGSWVSNGTCDGACGGGAGVLPEMYNITVPAAYGGTVCPEAQGDSRNTTTCTNNNPCPVDCVGSWVTQSNSCDGACAGGNGTLLEIYTITTTDQYGGQPCPTANGVNRRTLPCTNNNPCPVDCTYYWTPSGNCTGACSNGTGVLPEELVITSDAMYGGFCPGANGTTRSVTPCINSDPCPPVDCVGAWGATYSCNGTCEGGSGTGSQTFTITTVAAYGGVDCNYTHNAVRQVPCVNNNCPVDCVGVWNISGNCTGHCSGGSGFIPETYSRLVTVVCGGVQCPYGHGQVRNSITCVNNEVCPPQDCVGSWGWNGPCNGTCGGGAGIRPEIYTITVPAMYNGTDCPYTNSATRDITACTNSNPCPIDCVGHWSVQTGTCTGACQGGQGFVPEIFNVTVPDQYGGIACEQPNGTYRRIINCTNNNPCPPQNCQGTWQRVGSCTGGCGSVRLGGRVTEQFTITTPAAYGGANCSDAEGDTRISNCTNSSPCVNIPCNATWVTNGLCNGTCGGGSGHLPQRYNIYAVARDNGTPCLFPNNTLRQTAACVNNTPCPINCSGNWQTYGPCNGTCNNGTGVLPEMFIYTTPAQYGGANCSYANATTRRTTSCVNYTPCPIDCNGSWVPNGNCTGVCGGGAGLLPQRFNITTVAQHGGLNCSHLDGETRLNVSCNNMKPCPINCVGHWVQNGNCSGLCNNGTGTLPEKYLVTTPAMYEGALGCPYANGSLQDITPCINPTPCPIDCAGVYMAVGPCSGACSGGHGTVLEAFFMTVQAQYGGVCLTANGTQRNTTPCINSIPCDPVNCVGGYVAYGPCSALCGGNSGLLPERFTVTTPAAYGGMNCTVVNGTKRFSTACRNDTVCPYSDIQIVQSAPVLPPLNVSMNDSDIVIKGGNVSIIGVKVEGVGGSVDSTTTGSSSFTVDTIEAASNTTKPVKPRLAAFNGSLGFTTLGMIIAVVGEFELQRTMNWTWDETWSAWVTQVVVKGKSVLTREEIVNNVTVGMQTMDPAVAGYLTLYSAIYPGPGFSGTYDWAGQLQMAPNPFVEWDDATSLLLHNTSNSTVPNSRKRSRALLQSSSSSSTGQVPVQGRVSVREPKEATTGVGSTSAALDDSGDVMVVGPGPGPETNPNYVSTSPAPRRSSTTQTDDLITASGTNRKLAMIVLAAVVAPAGVALCASGIVAAVLYRKRRQKRDQDQQANSNLKGKVAKLGRLHKAPDGALHGQQHKRSSRSKGSSSNDAQEATLAEAELESSNPGSDNGADGGGAIEYRDGDAAAAAAQLRATQTLLERLAPGETGFGSMPGGQEAMVTMPPRQDSVDWSVPVPGPRQSYGLGLRSSVTGMRNSLTGIANGFAQALRFRVSQVGGAYGISEPAAAGFAAGTERSGGSMLWSSAVFPGMQLQRRSGPGHGEEHRMPTLPGGSSGSTYMTKQGSLDIAAVLGQSPVSPRGPAARSTDREAAYNLQAPPNSEVPVRRKPVTRSSIKERTD